MMRMTRRSPVPHRCTMAEPRFHRSCEYCGLAASHRTDLRLKDTESRYRGSYMKGGEEDCVNTVQTQHSYKKAFARRTGTRRTGTSTVRSGKQLNICSESLCFPDLHLRESWRTRRWFEKENPRSRRRDPLLSSRESRGNRRLSLLSTGEPRLHQEELQRHGPRQNRLQRQLSGGSQPPTVRGWEQFHPPPPRR